MGNRSAYDVCHGGVCQSHQGWMDHRTDLQPDLIDMSLAGLHLLQVTSLPYRHSLLTPPYLSHLLHVSHPILPFPRQPLYITLPKSPLKHHSHASIILLPSQREP